MNKVERIRINGVDYPYTKSIRDAMEISRISQPLMRERVKKGWTLYQAVNVPKGTTLEAFKQQKQRECQSRREYLTYQIFKDKKPHLFDGTPQHHSRDVYVSKLMSTSVFPEIKIDTFNNVQLV
ncbi:hypothetical protein AST13_02265 [Staphylococcus xylosus]|uniref:SA1788 family PVL leukocidin-associated protein n=1 Tax=Staphylococcus xylosus TaxID=1288 RepID=UPI000853A936|nr:SA1788 family PVL leukocidin-associated protein [Staphylococcus xylosus]OEL06883.1 hypothetical protein AST13_02265 [Staphylococcus xylosus]